MKNIASSSVLIQDTKGATLFIVDKNKVEFNENIKIVNEEYYSVGSDLFLGDKKYTIENIQFTWRDLKADFQTIITVR